MGERRSKRDGRGLAPTPLVALLNVIHLMIAAVCMVGSYFVMHSMLPLTILLSMGVLSRYHDYCWLTKITQAVEVSGEDCKDEDILPHAPFLNRVSDLFLDESVGDRVWPNLAALAIGINVCVALYRLSIHYNFPIVPGKVYGYIMLLGLIAWFASEIYIYTVYQDKPLCEACSFTEEQGHSERIEGFTHKWEIKAF